jgi:NADH pyrophosphatase NudC (nudix superfamily)
MAMIGLAITERKCKELRETLERLGGDPDDPYIQQAVDYLRAERDHDYCPIDGTYIITRSDGTQAPCVSCTRPRQPWPKSRQGYRPN